MTLAGQAHEWLWFVIFLTRWTIRRPLCFGEHPFQAGIRANMRLMFQAMVTRLHSPRTFSMPRN